MCCQINKSETHYRGEGKLFFEMKKYSHFMSYVTCHVTHHMSCHISHKGSSKTSFMYLVDPKNHILKVLWYYLNFWLKYKHFRNQGYKQGYTQLVIHDILYVLCRPQGSYPESFVALFKFLAEIKAFGKSGVQTGVWTGVHTMGHPRHSWSTV